MHRDHNQAALLSRSVSVYWLHDPEYRPTVAAGSARYPPLALPTIAPLVQVLVLAVTLQVDPELKRSSGRLERVQPAGRRRARVAAHSRADDLAVVSLLLPLLER